jgi:hypothetical protein
MPDFLILETDDGLTVVEREDNESAEDSALRHGGMVVDPGPFATLDEAQDALLLLAEAEDDDEPEVEPPV